MIAECSVNAENMVCSTLDDVCLKVKVTAQLRYEGGLKSGRICKSVGVLGRMNGTKLPPSLKARGRGKIQTVTRTQIEGIFLKR